MQLTTEEPRVAILQHVERRYAPLSWLFAKRLMDLFIGGIATIVALPIIAVAAIAIAIIDRGSPFYSQERVGLNGRRFRIFKLRTMVHGAHEMRDDILHLNEADGPVFKIKDDPRLHPLGKFLRRTSIDELPNLFNVLRGEMSLVGPRPPLPCETEDYSPYAMRRLTVLPGITCLWQINGRSTVTFDEWMRLDNLYIDTWTPLGDLLILWRTIPAVIRKDGAH
jgi:lipopolysaccharide/colanic/teichoic acid biosynthesis glycosyltransferase